MCGCQFWRLDVQDQGARVVRRGPSSTSQAARWVLTPRRGWELSGIGFIRALIPFTRVPPTQSNYLPNHQVWGLGFSKPVDGWGACSGHSAQKSPGLSCYRHLACFRVGPRSFVHWSCVQDSYTSYVPQASCLSYHYVPLSLMLSSIGVV